MTAGFNTKILVEAIVVCVVLILTTVSFIHNKAYERALLQRRTVSLAHFSQIQRCRKFDGIIIIGIGPQ
jgi:hypothetical protein